VAEDPEINWSEVVRQPMWKYLRRLELADEIECESELTEEKAKELSEKVKKDVAEYYRE